MSNVGKLVSAAEEIAGIVSETAIAKDAERDVGPTREPKKRRRKESDELTEEEGRMSSKGLGGLGAAEFLHPPADNHHAVPDFRDLSMGYTAPLGYTVSFEAEEEVQKQLDPPSIIQTPDWMNRAPPPHSLPPPTMAMTTMTNQFPNSLPSFTDDWMTTNLPMDRSLRPIYTYSFQESTFARRLLRASYERTYFALTNPLMPKEELHRIMKFGLCFGNIKTITKKLKEILTRSAQEPLGVWEHPVLHVGGAGLHFPRDVEKMEVPPIQGWVRERNIGPFSQRNAHIKTPNESFPYQLDVFHGMEGVWFDSHDVEMYLRTKGLFLDGSSPIAEMEVEESTPSISLEGTPRSGSMDTVSATEPISLRNSPVSGTGGQVTEFFSPSVDALLSTVAAGEDLSSAAANGFGFDFTLLQSTEAMDKEGVAEMDAAPINLFGELPAFDGEKAAKKRVTIDVDKLLEGKLRLLFFQYQCLHSHSPGVCTKLLAEDRAADEDLSNAALNQKSVCLGRAPGYRQSDVDAALDMVLQEAW